MLIYTNVINIVFFILSFFPPPVANVIIYYAIFVGTSLEYIKAYGKDHIHRIFENVYFCIIKC